MIQSEGSRQRQGPLPSECKNSTQVRRSDPDFATTIPAKSFLGLCPKFTVFEILA